VNEDEYITEKQPLFRSSGDRAFIHHNQIFLCGRTDDRIKRNGQFVSLVKLSNMISSIETIECCFSVFDRGRLFTFVQSAASNIVDRVSLERRILKVIREKSSDSYVPDRITILPSFPISDHGKTDSNGLLLQMRTGTSTCVLLESYIEQCWNVSLSSKELYGDNSDKTFSELGGDSFTAVYFVNRLLQGVSSVNNKTSEGGLYEKLFAKTLANSTLTDIQLYIQQELKDVFENTDNGETSSVRTKEHLQHNVTSECNSSKKRREVCGHHFIAFSRQLQNSTCDCGEIPKNFDCLSSSLKQFNQLRVEWKYNLGKCVDASPLVVFSDTFTKGMDFCYILNGVIIQGFWKKSITFN